MGEQDQGSLFFLDDARKPWQRSSLEEVPITRRFDGDTYEPPRDGHRLTGQLERVAQIMFDGEWHTLAELASKTGGTEASVSARIRDLRKPRFGARRVKRERVAGGLYRYRLDRSETQ